jgi:hypothetical protein
LRAGTRDGQQTHVVYGFFAVENFCIERPCGAIATRIAIFQSQVKAACVVFVPVKKIFAQRVQKRITRSLNRSKTRESAASDSRRRALAERNCASG